MSSRGNLARLLGSEVRWAVRRPGAVPESALHPEEARAVARAVERRRLEMAAGRDAARAALEALGERPVAIPVGERGAPVWPDGVIGSITHTEDWCLAAVARAGTIRSFGLDAEPDDPLEPALWPSITTEEELARLEALPVRQAGALARWLFCAKEAAYKCQFPLTATLLEFDDLAIRFAEPIPTTRPMMHSFDAVFRRGVPGFATGESIAGRLSIHAGRLVAAAFVGSERAEPR